MTAISKTYIACLLISLLLTACGSGGSAGNGGQTPGATVHPTPTGLQATAVDQQATPSLTITSSATTVATTSSIAPTVPLHAAFNTQGDIADLIALGFNLFDITGSKTNPASTLELVNALPEGTQALVWLGNMGNAPKGQSCPTPGFSDAEFKAQVDILANSPKVFGYNLADEPHPSVCPEAANAIQARSPYPCPWAKNIYHDSRREQYVS